MEFLTKYSKALDEFLKSNMGARSARTFVLSSSSFLLDEIGDILENNVGLEIIVPLR